VMLLTGAESIREVILFPHLKQRIQGAGHHTADAFAGQGADSTR